MPKRLIATQVLSEQRPLGRLWHVGTAVIATQVWREKTLPSETGHILRHTFRTIAQRVGIDKIETRLLLDHTVPGIDGVYIHEKALFDKLLSAQERMTAAILALTLSVGEVRG